MVRQKFGEWESFDLYATPSRALDITVGLLDKSASERVVVHAGRGDEFVSFNTRDIAEVRALKNPA